MAKKNEKNANCIVCGSKYHLCIACDRNKSNWKSWNVITDTEDCFNIYDIVSRYIAKYITKAEAKELLSAFDLSNLENFKDLIKNKIKEILDIPVETVKEVEVVVETMEEVVETVIEEVVEETTKKKRFSKKED